MPDVPGGTLDLAQFLPGLLTAIMVGILVSAWPARPLGTGRRLGVALMVSVGAILGTTLSPIHGIPDAGLQGTCDTTRIGIAPLRDLLAVSEASLNVALFIPLGICLGLVRWSRPAMFAVAGALLLPFVIEGTQLLLPVLNRYCDAADVADNLTGLIIGLSLGIVTAGAVRHHLRRRDLI